MVGLIEVSSHPLVAHQLTRLRDSTTSPAGFRSLVRSLTHLLAHEATADLPTRPVTIDTPLTRASFSTLAVQLAIVPILRAGLPMADALLELIPEAVVWHIGLYRDESTLQPHAYYARLPRTAPADIALIVDPMLATGGSALHACRLLHAAGIRRVKLLCLIAAPEGVQRLHAEFPAVAIHTGALDQRLNDVGYIVPGLGDAGDRLYGTLPTDG
ncbi:MAG: uracil phosphoribosyltransferase [Isosphaeraceae bacterium]|jgi:uracil phosphoribosyltransferase|nr:MAG: uracil phosphoribosyltransferase [Isosphaeraceae bacterium]